MFTGTELKSWNVNLDNAKASLEVLTNDLQFSRDQHNVMLRRPLGEHCKINTLQLVKHENSKNYLVHENLRFNNSSSVIIT
ncbi:hypothetical protein MKW92_016754, partial [Papaver armeniacum]